MKLDQQIYFNRSGTPPKDGRSFDQRTLQAVNRTAYDVSSYRQFIIALDQAGPGETVTVSGAVTVPKTILINKQVKIQCIGQGVFIPGADSLTMFRVNDVANVYFLDVRVRANGNIITQRFIEHVQTVVEGESLKNLTVRRCYAEAQTFIVTKVDGGVPKSMEYATGNNYGFKFLGNRSIIDSNEHIGLVPKTADTQNSHFMLGAFYMCTITNNESKYSYIDLTDGGGTGNIIDSNVIGGWITWEVLGVTYRTAIRIDTSCKINIVTSNILPYDALNAAGAAPVDTVVANNREWV